MVEEVVKPVLRVEEGPVGVVHGAGRVVDVERGALPRRAMARDVPAGLLARPARDWPPVGGVAGAVRRRAGSEERADEHGRARRHPGGGVGWSRKDRWRVLLG